PQPGPEQACQLAVVHRLAGRLRTRGRLRDHANPEDRDEPDLAASREGRPEGPIYGGRRGGRRAMKARRIAAALAALSILALAIGCGRMPGQPSPGDEAVASEKVLDFDTLFK